MVSSWHVLRTCLAGAACMGPPRTMSAAVWPPPHFGGAVGAAVGAVGGGVPGPAAVGPLDRGCAEAGAAGAAGMVFAFVGLGPLNLGAGRPGPLLGLPETVYEKERTAREEG